MNRGRSGDGRVFSTESQMRDREKGYHLRRSEGFEWGSCQVVRVFVQYERKEERSAVARGEKNRVHERRRRKIRLFRRHHCETGEVRRGVE